MTRDIWICMYIYIYCKVPIHHIAFRFFHYHHVHHWWTAFLEKFAYMQEKSYGLCYDHRYVQLTRIHFWNFLSFGGRLELHIVCLEWWSLVVSILVLTRRWCAYLCTWLLCIQAYTSCKSFCWDVGHLVWSIDVHSCGASKGSKVHFKSMS